MRALYAFAALVGMTFLSVVPMACTIIADPAPRTEVTHPEPRPDGCVMFCTPPEQENQ